MRTRAKSMIRRRVPRGLAAAVLPIILLTCGGCGLLLLPTDIAGFVSGAEPADGTQIAADVTVANADTGLPTQLAGSVTGEYEAAYAEEMLEVYFDDNGVPIAALSRSVLTFSGTEAGSIISLNLIVVLDFVFATDASGAPMLDEQGAPIVIGLETAAAGQIIAGTGAYEGVTGELHADSTLMFVGGAANLGTVESDVTLILNDDQTAGGDS